MRGAQELLDRIVTSARIPAAKRRHEIQRELRAHIEDFVVAAREAGRSQEEIERQLLAHFGDPDQIARGFAFVYRHERRRLRALVFALSTVLLAGGLLAAVLAAQAGLAFGFGTPVMHVIASTHTVIEALDIVAAVAVYLGVSAMESLFERHRFQKAALLLIVLLTAVMVVCNAAGWHISWPLVGIVSGVFFRAVQLFITSTLARVGIVALCFPLIGLLSALLRSPASPVALATTYASWLVLGLGYQLMTVLAVRIDTALVNGLQRIQQGLLKGALP